MSTPAPETTSAPARVPRHTLTGPAAVVLALGVCLVGALVDELTGRGLGLLFDVCFVVGCVLGALRVRRSGLRTIAVAPPLLYAFVTGLTSTLRGSSAPRGLETRVMDLVTEIVFGAPALVAGTLLTLGVVLLRVAQRR